MLIVRVKWLFFSFLICKQGLRNTAGLWYDPEIDKRDGKLLAFDFNNPDQDPVELTLKNFNRKGFNPHGISVYHDPSSGQVSLFVVNHRPDAQAIEIFDFGRETYSLIHRRSVVDDLIWSPNDVYAVGKWPLEKLQSWQSFDGHLTIQWWLGMKL